MIRTDDKKGQTIKAMKAREKQEKEKAMREKCDAWAYERFGEQEIKGLSNKHKGLWYLTVEDDDGNVEKCLILQPINRHILSYASTKIAEDGLYVFLEAVMRECAIEGDMEIIEEDEYFIPAAMVLDDILKGKKASLLKR